MGEVLALCKGEDEDGGCRTAPEALGSNPARRGRGRKDGQKRARLEAGVEEGTGLNGN